MAVLLVLNLKLEINLKNNVLINVSSNFKYGTAGYYNKLYIYFDWFYKGLTDWFPKQV